MKDGFHCSHMIKIETNEMLRELRERESNIRLWHTIYMEEKEAALVKGSSNGGRSVQSSLERSRRAKEKGKQSVEGKEEEILITKQL